MLIRSLASGAVAEVDDAVAPEMLLKGWVEAGRVPAPKKGAPVAAVVDPAVVDVVVPDPADKPKRAPRKTTR